MAVGYGTEVQYGTIRLIFCKEVWYAGVVCLFCNGTGTVRWYAV